MGEHDREITGGREQTIEGGVVLRFPGDWVGPLEELVPFGPSADRELTTEGEPAPRAADFWGEDSAMLQDAVELPEQPPAPRRAPPPIRRWLLPAGAALAATLFALAAVIGGSGSTAPRVHGVTFAIASLPSLAPAAETVQHGKPKHRRVAFHPRSHSKPTRATQVSTSGAGSSSVTTTSSPTYTPAPAPSTSAGSTSSQSGGAFTLGGP